MFSPGNFLEIAEGSGSDRVVEARGLLFQVNSVQFLLSLLLFERIFSITAKLSDLLQAERLNYAAAAACIKASTRSTKGNRVGEHMGTSCGIVIKP